MEANVTEKEQMFFLGMGEVFRSAADHDADLVMFKQYMPHASDFEQHAIDSALYAVGRTREDGSCTYMVGRRVAAMQAIPGDVPSNSTYTSIPASTYVEIKTTPRELGAVEQSKTKRWFEKHPEYRVHPDAVGVEYYPQDCQGADDEMWTWYPIVPAQ
jgi:predicted transcriptional regulator YdeE